MGEGWFYHPEERVMKSYIDRIEALLTEAIREAQTEWGTQVAESWATVRDESVAEERNECAKVVESINPICPEFDTVSNATSCLKYNIAAQIRARGGK